jgi:hypothetical protein
LAGGILGVDALGSTCFIQSYIDYSRH